MGLGRAGGRATQASIIAQIANVRDRIVAYLGPDRMIDLTPEGHA